MYLNKIKQKLKKYIKIFFYVVCFFVFLYEKIELLYKFVNICKY